MLWWVLLWFRRRVFVFSLFFSPHVECAGSSTICTYRLSAAGRPLRMERFPFRAILDVFFFVCAVPRARAARNSLSVALPPLPPPPRVSFHRARGPDRPGRPRFLTHVHAVSIAPPWVGALLTAMRVPTKNAVQVKKVIEASGIDSI